MKLKAPRFGISKSLPGGFRIGTSFGVEKRAERARAVIDPFDAFLALIGEKGGTVAVKHDELVGWQTVVAIGPERDSAEFYGCGDSLTEAVRDVQMEMGWVR